MVKKYASRAKNLHRQRGIAATEFALIAPIMLLFFFSAVEGSTIHSQHDKVLQAASILADVSAKEAQMGRSEIDDLFIGIENIVQPLESTKLKMNLISVVPDNSGNPIVHWSRSNQDSNKVPYSPGAPFTKVGDNRVLKGDFSLIIAEVEYDSKSGLTGFVLGEVINHAAQKIRVPRKSNRIALCDLRDNEEYTNCTF